MNIKIALNFLRILNFFIQKRITGSISRDNMNAIRNGM